MKQHDDSRPGTFKSGGQRIDDHSFWAGAKSKDSVFPDGPHKCKDERSAEGSGSVMKYEDTTEAIKAGQMEGSKKIKAHPMKQPNYRN
jgi:hypothetical protein